MEEKKLADIMQAKNYDLVVVTTKLHDQLNGQTVAWFSQASVKPPMVGIGLSIDTLTSQMIKQSGIFCINFIPKNYQELIEHFGYQSGRQINKFVGVDFSPGVTGCPVLKAAAAFLDCEVRTITNLDGSDFIFGEVIDSDYSTLDWISTKDFKAKAA